MTSNRSFSRPARTTESTSDTYGTFHVSNTHRVQPSSIAAAYDLYSPTRGALPVSNPAYPVVACGSCVAPSGAESGTRNESGAATAVTFISKGSVCAVTSYGSRGGPPG